MSDYFSKEVVIVNYNNDVLDSVAKEYPVISSFIAGESVQVLFDLDNGVFSELKTTTLNDIEAGQLKPYMTEIPHFKTQQSKFDYSLFPYVVRTSVGAPQKTRFGDGEEVKKRAVKGMTRQWDTNIYLSMYNNNKNNIKFLPNITGALSLDAIIQAGLSIKKQIRENLLIREQNVKLVINDTIDVFLAKQNPDGTQLNRVLFEQEFGKRDEGYIVLNTYVNNAYINFSTSIGDPNAVLTAGQGFLCGVYSEAAKRLHGFVPQLYKEWEMDSSYNYKYDFVFHNGVIKISDHSVVGVVLTNA